MMVQDAVEVQNEADTLTFLERFMEQLSYGGDRFIVSPTGRQMIKDLIKRKRVGRWDELLHDEDAAIEKSTPSIVNDVIGLVQAWKVREDEADKLETPPNELERYKFAHQLARQIIKTVGKDLEKLKE